MQGDAEVAQPAVVLVHREIGRFVEDELGVDVRQVSSDEELAVADAELHALVEQPGVELDV